MSSSAEIEQTALIMGFGNSGQRLHANTLADAEAYPDVTTLAYDLNPDLQLHEQTREKLETALGAGRLVIANEIAKKPADVVVISTPPGAHVDAVEQVVAAYGRAGYTLPKAWIFEKAVVDSEDEERRLRELLDSGVVNESDTFVYETRLLSSALLSASGRARELEAAGHTITEINSMAYKNRLPDVNPSDPNKKPRFSGRPHQVEFPHKFAEAYTLGNLQLSYDQLTTNKRYDNIDGMPKSEGTFTVFQAGATTVRIAQGLGEFHMDYRGGMFYNPNPGVARTIQAKFDSGDEVRVRFDPLNRPGMPKMSSTFEHIDADGRTVDLQVHPEKPVSVLWDAALRHARGEDSGLPDGTRIPQALANAALITAVEQSSELIDGIRTA